MSGIGFCGLSGKFIDLINIDPSAISIYDIARSLSNQCRYRGHIHRFVSVAEHSLMVASAFELGSFEYIWGLIHDVAEAYVSDVPTPVKPFTFIGGLPVGTVEDRILEAVGTKFGVGTEMPDCVKPVDRSALCIEGRALFPDRRYLEWPGYMEQVLPKRELRFLQPDDVYPEFVEALMRVLPQSEPMPQLSEAKKPRLTASFGAEASFDRRYVPSVQDIKILDFLEKHKRVIGSWDQISEIIKMPASTLRTRVKKLSDNDLISYTPSGRGINVQTMLEAV